MCDPSYQMIDAWLKVGLLGVYHEAHLCAQAKHKAIRVLASKSKRVANIWIK